MQNWHKIAAKDSMDAEAEGTKIEAFYSTNLWEYEEYRYKN